MEFKSAFLDSLSISMRSRYDISDEGIISLSDILIKMGIDDMSDAAHILELVYFLDKREISLPVSYKYLKNLWESSFYTFDFNSIMIGLMEKGLISTRKLNPKQFFNAIHILKDSSEVEGSDISFLVVYSNNTFSTLFKYIKDLDIITDDIQVTEEKIYQNDVITVTEGVNFKDLDKKFSDFVIRVVKGIREKIHLKVILESFDYDSIKNSIEFNFVVTIPRFPSIKIKDKDLVNILNRELRNKYIYNFDISVDSFDSLFLSLATDMRALRSDYIKVAEEVVSGISAVIDELEKKLQ